MDLKKINFIFIKKIEINIDNFIKILKTLNISNYNLFFDSNIENYDDIIQKLNNKNIGYKIIRSNDKYNTICAPLDDNDKLIIEDLLSNKEDFFITERNMNIKEDFENVIKNPGNFVYDGFIKFSISFIVNENEIEIILNSNSEELKAIIENLHMAFDKEKIKIHSDSYKIK